VRNFVIRLLVNALALWVAAELVSGIRLSDDFGDILLVALVFGIVNALLKPVLILLSLPFLLVTLGLFALVVNGALLMVTAALTERLAVSGFGAAVLGSIVISLVTMFMGRVLEDELD